MLQNDALDHIEILLEHRFSKRVHIEMLRASKFDLSIPKFSNQEPYWNFLMIKKASGDLEGTQYNHGLSHSICLLENDT